MNNTFNVAQSLAKNGIKVYPLSPGSKIPVAGSHGEHDATDDLDTIKKWFDYNPNFNLAINLQASGLAVIDLDKHNNTTDGVQNYSKYLLNHGNNYMDSLKTYTELTPRGGVHIFYKLNQILFFVTTCASQKTPLRVQACEQSECGAAPCERDRRKRLAAFARNIKTVRGSGHRSRRSNAGR